MRMLAFVLVASLIAGAGAPLAEAQTSSGEIVVAQSDERPGGLFRFLFGKRERSLSAPRDRIRKLRERRRERTRSSSRSRPAAPARPDNYSVARLSDAPPELDEAQQRVLVVGDFFARAVAQGLAEAFEENPNIEVISAGNGSSGLVRDDFYDWRKALPEFNENYQPAAIVVMIGGNDRQAIRMAGGSVQPRTEAWDAAYRARVTAFMETLKATGRPIFWAGLVPVRSPGMSRDYSGFNTIYREQAPASGIVFVEMWNGFADSDGRFVSRGPDVNGQNRQLRVSDGLNFTPDGRRKLAFFVERDLRQVLKAAGGPQFVSAPAGDEETDARSISAMVSIDSYAGDAGARLSTFGVEEEASTDAEAGKEDDAEADPTLAVGRIDDYQWPRPVPTAVAPVEEASETPAAETAEAGG